MNRPIDRDTWETPLWLFNWLNDRFKFDIDLAASKENRKCEAYFSKENDALNKDWHKNGSVGFCNPPYSNISPWLERARIYREEDFKSVFVLPSPKGDNWQGLLFHANELIFIQGRVSFVCNGSSISGNNNGTVIAIYSHWTKASPAISNIKRDEIRRIYDEPAR